MPPDVLVEQEYTHANTVAAVRHCAIDRVVQRRSHTSGLDVTRETAQRQQGLLHRGRARCGVLVAVPAAIGPLPADQPRRQLIGPAVSQAELVQVPQGKTFHRGTPPHPFLLAHEHVRGGRLEVPRREQPVQDLLGHRTQRSVPGRVAEPPPTPPASSAGLATCGRPRQPGRQPRAPARDGCLRNRSSRPTDAARWLGGYRSLVWVSVLEDASGIWISLGGRHARRKCRYDDSPGVGGRLGG